MRGAVRSRVDREGCTLEVHLLDQERMQVARTPRHQLVGVLGNRKNGGLLLFPIMELHLLMGALKSVI